MSPFTPNKSPLPIKLNTKDEVSRLALLNTGRLLIMELSQEQRFTVIEKLAPWFTPKFLQEEFGISYSTLYFYQRQYGIKNFRLNIGEVKNEFKTECENYINEMCECNLAEVREMLKGGNKD